MKKRMKFISPGAGVATFLAIISSIGFSYYVNNFNSYNQIYGSLGSDHSHNDMDTTKLTCPDCGL